VTLEGSVWLNTYLGRAGGLDLLTPNDLLTGLGDIETFPGSLHSRPTECSSNISGDVQLLLSGSGHLL
jgi:hypothetical protein